jgi:hypothetical protein
MVKMFRVRSEIIVLPVPAASRSWRNANGGAAGFRIPREQSGRL